MLLGFFQEVLTVILCFSVMVQNTCASACVPVCASGWYYLCDVLSLCVTGLSESVCLRFFLNTSPVSLNPKWDSRWAEAWLECCSCSFNQLAAAEGLSIITTLPSSSNTITASVAQCPALRIISNSIDMNKYSLIGPFKFWLYFSWSIFLLMF